MKKLYSALTVAIFVVFMVVGFTACEKDLQISKDHSNLVIPTNCLIKSSESKTNLSNENLEKEILCQVIAKALTNIEFRVLLKQEALKMFDGDYDILYSTLKNININSNQKVSDYFYEIYKNDEKNIMIKSDFDKMCSSIKDFQISVPINCEMWDEKNEKLLVTYIPNKFDEKKIKEVRAFDMNGNVYFLSTQIEPEVPVVVIGSCERINKNESNSIFSKYNNNSKFAYNKPLKLNGIYFNDLSLYETWIQGKPEIHGELYRDGSEYTLGSFYDKPDRDEVDEKWKVYNITIVPSWVASYGENLYFKFWEDDVKTELEVPLTLSTSIPISTQPVAIPLSPSIGVKIKWTIGEDDDMGTYTIHISNKQVSRTNGTYKFIVYQ